ncbi:MAG TPA: hypothetical protein VMZ51_05745 [Acidimicrobiales bacterium]|nr:hypothetical protein [Acidimicrobiales bacterium]
MAAIAAGAAFVGLIAGSSPRLPLPLFLLVGVLGVVLFRSRTVRAIEVGWTGAPAPAPAPVVAVPPLPLGAPRGGGGSVARALARFEARQLATGACFAVGIGFWAMVYLTFGVLWVDDVDRSWSEFVGRLTMMSHPFAAAAIIAAHRNRTRSTRDGCDELFDACPADADTRTRGHLATAWVGAVVCVVGAVGMLVLVAARNSRLYGPFDREVAAELAATAVIGAGAVVLGVTLGRWARWSLTPVLAVVGIGVLGGQINQIGGQSWATDRLLSTFVPSGGIDALYYTRPVWGRTAWLLGLTVLVGVLALVGRRPRRILEATAAGAAVITIVAALVVVRPASRSDAASIAERIAQPVAHARCLPAGAGVRVCSYEEYAELATRTVAAIRPVAAAVPPSAREGVTFLTYFEKRDRQLQREVRDALAGRTRDLPGGVLRLRFHSHPDNFAASRFRLAARAVGLPTEARPGGEGTVVAGQARGVVALWLATRGMSPADTARRLRDADRSPGDPRDASDRGAIWPGGCSDEPSVLQWSPTDLRAARLLVGRPAAVVANVIRNDWDRFTDPVATTDDLLRAVGMTPLGTPERIEAREYSC